MSPAPGRGELEGGGRGDAWNFGWGCVPNQNLKLSQKKSRPISILYSLDRNGINMYSVSEQNICFVPPPPPPPPHHQYILLTCVSELPQAWSPTQPFLVSSEERCVTTLRTACVGDYPRSRALGIQYSHYHHDHVTRLYIPLI